eukprot:7119947-Alexandrium_andersonii.AAC.1
MRPEGREGHGGAPLVQAIGGYEGRLDRAAAALIQAGREVLDGDTSATCKEELEHRAREAA